jgi:hypothetical protein
MRNPQLKLTDLVLGLERFGDRYEAIDVFADDVLEAWTGQPVPGLQLLDAEGRRYRYTPSTGGSYDVEVFPAHGILRLSRPTAVADLPGAVAGALVGAAAGAITGVLAYEAVRSAQTKKGEAAAAGLVLGLLAGAALAGGVQPNAPRRVFTLRFDPVTGQWRAYDGGLVRWMKEHLLPQSA